MKVIFLPTGISILKKEKGIECAEISSMIKFNEQFTLKNSDVCIMLLSDDRENIKSSQKVEEILQKQFKIKTEKHIVKQLNIKTLKKDFFNKLIWEVGEIVIKQIEKYSSEKEVEFYINLTSGYKIINYFMLLLGMIYKFKLFYIFEDGKDLLFVPNLKIKLDTSIWFDYYEIFKSTLTSNFTNNQETTKQIPDVLKIFIKKGGNKRNYTLTSLGKILLDQVLNDYCDDKISKKFLWKRKFVEDYFIRKITDSLPLSLLMIDIDKFKSVNDYYGHDEGDYILEQFVEVILNELDNINPKDFFIQPEFIRWGGEEFLIIFQTSNRKTIQILAEKLRNKIENFNFLLKNKPQTLKKTISIGGCENIINPNDFYAFEQLYKCADEKLYEAKKDGRNNCKISLFKERSVVQ